MKSNCLLNARGVALASLAIALAALVAAPPACAQSSPVYNPSTAGSVMPVASKDASDDSAAAHSGWERYDDQDIDPGDSSGETLEIPQRVYSGGSQSSRDDSSAPPNDDQIGSGDDSVFDDSIAGVYLVPIPWPRYSPCVNGFNPYCNKTPYSPAQPSRDRHHPYNPSRPNRATSPLDGNASYRSEVAGQLPNSMNSGLAPIRPTLGTPPMSAPIPPMAAPVSQMAPPAPQMAPPSQGGWPFPGS